MKNIKNNKKLQLMIFTLIAIITLGIGYAGISAINAIVNINATAGSNQTNFKVNFKTANITTGTGTATIDPNDATVAYFDVSGLSKEGDSAVATYTIKNESHGVGAHIDLEVTNSNTEYFSVVESVTDNELQAGDSTTATITVTMLKTPVSDAVSTTITGNLTASPIENANATGNSGATATPATPNYFATDSWSTIQTNVHNGNIDRYNIGDTKTVTIDNKDYTVRISNKSSYNWCDDTSYSQTACGFVVEFVDSLELYRMNTSTTNKKGYPSTRAYGYINSTLYGKLPSDLKDVLSQTRVISGYCPDSGDTKNFVTNNYLYLLSTEEVYGIDSSGRRFDDNAYGTSTQLDYYKNNNVSFSMSTRTGTNLDLVQKKYVLSNSFYSWWLRSAAYDDEECFTEIDEVGRYSPNLAYNSMGISPAFRIV